MKRTPRKYLTPKLPPLRRFPKGNKRGPVAAYVAEFCTLNNLTHHAKEYDK